MKNPLGYKCRYGCRDLLRSAQSRSHHYRSIHHAEYESHKFVRKFSELKCPDCAKTSSSLQGLKKHHLRAHRKKKVENFTMKTLLSSAPQDGDDLLKAI